MTNIFKNLWELALDMIELIGKAWDWLNDDLIINIPLKIPVIFPDGINWDLGFQPIWLLTGGMAALIIYWVVLK